MPKLLDLFCGAGLAADGYAKAGFEVIGVDINPQPNYPYEFIQTDAVHFLDVDGLLDIDVIHASPPCQLFTRAGRLRDAQGGVSKYQDLLTPILQLLGQFEMPWVVENVPGAKDLMPGAVTLCGSAFNLDIQRHRLFMSNIGLEGTVCNHSIFPLDPVTKKPRPWGIYHVPKDSIPSGGRTALSAEHAQVLMGVDRSLSWGELKEGIPPSYTEYIGNQLMRKVE